MNPMRVLLADDHSLMRAGIAALLNQVPNLEIVGEARDGLEAIQMIITHHPNLILMDIGMTPMNGLDATARITR